MFLLANVPIGLAGTYETVVLVAKMELEIGTQTRLKGVPKRDVPGLSCDDVGYDGKHSQESCLHIEDCVS